MLLFPPHGPEDKYLYLPSRCTHNYMTTQRKLKDCVRERGPGGLWGTQNLSNLSLLYIEETLIARLVRA